jgi:hypothetical protein
MPLSFTIETAGKKLAVTKTIGMVNVKSLQKILTRL